MLSTSSKGVKNGFRIFLDKVVVFGMRLIRRPWKGANFEMCHLWSLGRVTNFKNEVCANGGVGFNFFEFLTCCTFCRMIIKGGGGGGEGCGGGVLTFLTSTSFTLRKMHTLQMLSYDHQGGGDWGAGGWGVYSCSWRALPLHYGRCARCTCCHIIIRGVNNFRD